MKAAFTRWALVPMSVLVAFVLQFYLALPALATTITIDIRAFTDGRDLLIVQGNSLQWHHLDFAAVGRHLRDGNGNEPTIITTTLNGATVMDQANWIPDWPEPPPAEIRYEAFSSTFTLNPALPTSGQMTVTLTPIAVRDSLTIAQYPSSSNAFTTLVDFNDDPSSGATWYEALLTIETPTSVGKSLGNPCDCSGAREVGYPINVATGNEFERVTDYETSGQNKLGFTRYYNSLSASSTLATTLGSHWRSTYDRYLNLSASNVTVERADGQQLTYSLKGTLWTSDTDVDYTLTNSGSTWELRGPDDTVETYTADSTGAAALLDSIKVRNGYTQMLTYNSSDQLVSVKDSYNRSLVFTYNDHLLDTMTTPDGLVLSYSYDSSRTSSGVNDRLITVTYSTTPQTKQTYLYETPALPFALTGIIDEDGKRFATWSYDSSGRATSSQHGGGVDLTTVYDDTAGNRIVTNALGEQEVYKFTTLQGVPKLTEIDRLGTSTTAPATRNFTYDSNGYTASETDWNGNLTKYVNDFHGQPTSITEASGTPYSRTTSITYLPDLHLPSQIVTQGLTTDFNYDSNGNLLSKTEIDTTSSNDNRRTWKYTWSNSLLASEQGPRTDVTQLTTYRYDASGALKSIINPLGQKTRITAHTPSGLPEIIIDPNGVPTKRTYDQRQRLLTSTVVTQSGALTTRYLYDGAGNLTYLIQPDGSGEQNTYDAAHRLIGTTDFLNQSIVYKLDALGDRLQTLVIDASGKVQRRHTATFDALGRMLTNTGGAGQTTFYTYDSNGNQRTVANLLGQVTHNGFDQLNRLTTVVDPANGLTKTLYDAHDRPTSITDPNNHTTQYTYDGFGNLIQQLSPDTGTTSRKFDPAGNLIRSVDAAGVVSKQTYDALDRVTSTSYPGNRDENIEYTYDEVGLHGFGVGRLTTLTDAAGQLSRTYDERGNIVVETRSGIRNALGFSLNTTLDTVYHYDPANRLSRIRYPSGARVKYNRDKMGRLD